MSKADKMFKKLGYSKNTFRDYLNYIQLDEKGDIMSIGFDYNKKGVFIRYETHDYPGISMQELQAINEKCKELGWI